jgi:hypothetical protein
MPSFTFDPIHALTENAILALISSLITLGTTLDPDHRAHFGAGIVRREVG